MLGYTFGPVLVLFPIAVVIAAVFDPARIWNSFWSGMVDPSRGDILWMGAGVFGLLLFQVWGYMNHPDENTNCPALYELDPAHADCDFYGALGLLIAGLSVEILLLRQPEISWLAVAGLFWASIVGSLTCCISYSIWRSRNPKLWVVFRPSSLDSCC